MLVIKFKDIIKYLACIILIISVFILFARYFLNLNKDKKFIMLNMHSNIAKRDKSHRDTY